MTGIMTLAALSSHSRMGQRVRRRFASQLHLLPAGLPNPASMAQTLEALLDLGLDLGSALRTIRQLVLERLLCLDCDAQTPLQQVTQAMTDLAEFCLNQACLQVQQTLDRAWGSPNTTAGTRAPPLGVGTGR